MAGESPGKSQQKNLPGDGTAEAAPSVPRGRDPRLALYSADPGEASGEATEASENSEAPRTSGDSGKDGAAGGEEPQPSTEETPGTGPRVEPETSAADSEGDAGSEGGPAVESAAESRDTDGAESADAAEASEGAGASEGADTDTDTDGAGTDGGGADSAGAEPEGSADARLRAAVAAWVTGDGTAEGDADAAADPATESAAGDADVESAGVAEAPEETVSAAGEPEGRGAEPTEPAEPAEPAEPSATDEPAESSAAETTESAEPTDATADDADTDTDTDPEPASGSDSPEADADDATADSADDADSADADADADAADSGEAVAEVPAPRPVDQATAVFKLPAEPVDQATRTFKRPDAEPAKGAAKSGAAAAAALNTGTAKSEPGKSEPAKPEAVTASPAAPTDTATDTATDTPAAPTDTATDVAAGSKEATAAEAERTSRFVALKDLDEPRAPAVPHPAGPGPMPPPAGTGGPADGAGRGPAAPADPDGYGLTRQQPLPPLPPLDLLAELTNTPPPPDTPLRTVIRRVKIWTPLVLLLAIVLGVVQALRPLPEPGLTLSAQESFTFDGDKPAMPWPEDGQAAMMVEGIGDFGSSGEQKPTPIASVAKVMTAYVILRDHPVKKGSDGATITMDQKAEDDAKLSAVNESTVDVRKGQKMTQKEALHALLLASANNIARQLARWDAGSETAFAKKMNEAAEELGMKNTTYTDPSGLMASTKSTAVDQTKLARKVMEYPVFREIVGKSGYTDLNDKWQKNWNDLVPVNGVVGIKTGTTTAANGNLMFAAVKEVDGVRQTVVGAILNQPPSAGTNNSILAAATEGGNRLMQAAREVLEAKTVVRKGDVVGTVDDGLGGSVPVVVTEDVSAVGWAGLTVELEVSDNGKTVPHSAKAGTVVGVLKVGDGDNGAVEVPVALQSDLAEPGFGDKLTRLG